MNQIKVTGRKGQRYVPIRLRAGLSAIVFELSNGTKIEVDLMESGPGNLLIRADDGAVQVASKSGSVEVTTKT
jgi:hypothetical protein